MNAWQDAWVLVQHPLLLPLVVTGLAGLLAYVMAHRAPVVSRFVSPLACAIALGLMLRLFTGEAVAIDLTFVSAFDLRIGVAMTAHPFGMLIALGAAFFGLLIAVYARTFERGGQYEGRFHAFLCWTVAGAMGAALATDLVWLLICWEVVSLCLYMMLNLGSGDSPAGAAKTFGMLGVGDAALLLAIALIGTTQGTFRIDELSIQVGTPLTYTCYLLFVAAALAKAGAIPLHSWIPAAASSASAATFALLPAAIDKLLGIYLLALFSLQVFVLDTAMQRVLLVIGAVTILAAVLMAMMQHQLKKLLGFHAVSQVGYMVLGIGTGLPIGIAGGVFHMVNNAIYKAALFMMAGDVERETGTDELNRLGGLAAVLPTTFMVGLVSALAISGIPPLNGFVSKWLVYQACLSLGTPLAMLSLVAAVFGSALTLASFFKVISAVFLGPAAKPAGAGGRKGRLALNLPMIALAALCIGFGVLAAWPLNSLVLPAIAGMGIGVGELTAATTLEVEGLGLWSPTPATMLILLGVVGGLLLYAIGRVGRARVVGPFIGGEVADEPAGLKFAATSYYRTIEELPGLGGALREGSRSVFDVYNLGGRFGGTFVELLRRQHTGVLSLYVTWCLVGLVVIAAYVMAVI